MTSNRAPSIAIEARWSGQHGIGRYSHEVLVRLRDHTVIRSTKIRPASLFDPLWLGAQVARQKVDILFNPGYNAALRIRDTRQILVVHDLIHLDVEEESSTAKKRYYNQLVRPAIRHANLVFTVSEFSKQRIAEWANFDARNVVVAGGGLSQSFQIPRPRLDITNPYVLFVGDAKPHKRLEFALQVMESLPGLNLVIVGRHGPSPGVCKNVITKTGISEDALADLYRGASCLLMPSTYEGFGLPALEAASQGTPVVFSSTAVAEIIGTAMDGYVPPTSSPREFASMVRHVLSQDQAHYERPLLEIASKYTWDKTTDVIDEAVYSRFGVRLK